MKILACGDIHLTNYTLFNRPTDDKLIGSRLRYILKALEYFFKYGHLHNIQVYVINGDLFDKRQSENPSLIAEIRYNLISSFRSITPNGSLLLINVGNHGEYGRTPEYNSARDFELYSTKKHTILVFSSVSAVDLKSYTEVNEDSLLMFIPYTEKVKEQKQEIKKCLANYDSDSKHITVFAHLGVDGATQGRWNHRLSSAYNLDDLGWNDPNVKSIINSHFHQRQSLKKNGNKEAYYIGDLTELNFNDLGSDGKGAPRGFEEIDTITGQHKLIDLTKDPYNIPTFNQLDLQKGANLGLKMLNPNNYYRITTKDRKQYDYLSKERESLKNASNIQVVYIPPEIKTEIDVNPNASDKELVAKYCDKNYPKLKSKALDYLRKAHEVS